MYFKICFKWIITTPWKTILDAGCINKHTHVPYASISYNHIKPLKDKYIVINIILRGWVRKKAIHVFFSFASSQAFGTSCFNLFVNITFAFTYVAINSMKPAISRISITERSFFFLLRVLLEFFFFWFCMWVVWQKFYWAVAIHMTTHPIVSPWQTKVWITSKFTLMNWWVLLELLRKIQIKVYSQDQKWFENKCIIKDHPNTSSCKEANWSKLYIQ